MPINIVLDFIFNSANWSTIYWFSCAWYLLHLVLARRTWTVKPKNMVPVRAPFWTRTSLIWLLSPDQRQVAGACRLGLRAHFQHTVGVRRMCTGRCL